MKKNIQEYLENYEVCEDKIKVLEDNILELKKQHYKTMKELVKELNKARQQRIVFGCPFVFLSISFATQLNIPLLVAILTIIIIDTSKKITLKSM